MSDVGQLQMSDDVYDIGMLAFHLLDGVKENSFGGAMSVANMSVAMSVAMISERNYVGDHWKQISDHCKELLAFMVHED